MKTSAVTFSSKTLLKHAQAAQKSITEGSYRVKVGFTRRLHSEDPPTSNVAR